MVNVPKGKIKQDPIHYAKINSAPQSRDGKQGASFTLLNTGASHSLLPSTDTRAREHVAARMAMSLSN